MTAQTEQAEYWKKVIGYGDKLTVRPGETIDFKISTEQAMACDAQLVKLISGGTYADLVNYKEQEIPSTANGRHTFNYQPSYTGSCVIVDDSAPINKLSEFTLTLAVKPTMVTAGRQHLIGCWDDNKQQGWSLQLDDQGHFAFVVGDGSAAPSVATLNLSLENTRWYCYACINHVY